MKETLEDTARDFINFVKLKDISLIKNTDIELESLYSKLRNYSFDDILSLFDSDNDDMCEQKVMEFVEKLDDGIVDRELIEITFDTLLQVLKDNIRE